MNIREHIKSLDLTIIGLTGRKMSGKSTFAAEVTANHPFALRLAFADPIRSVCLAVFGSEYRTQEEKHSIDAFWHERLGDDWSTGRKILQRLGTEVFRGGVSEDIWLHVFERRLLSLIPKIESGHVKPIITVDDCRFQNEAELIKEMGGKIIRMINDNGPPATDTHASEAGLPESLVDHTFHVCDEAEVRAVAKAYRYCMNLDG